MRLDYWNHPLVVSAYRVRFRGRAPQIAAATYFLALVSLGAILHEVAAYRARFPWINYYFTALVSIETLVAAAFAFSNTMQSMRQEVVNRTLDYQRIAAISPRDILIGKLLGEPAQGYLAVVVGLPLLVWCCAMGAAPLTVLALCLVNLVTTALLAGSLGMIQPFDTTVDTGKRSSRGAGLGTLFFLLIFGGQVLVQSSILMTSPIGRAVLGLFTPIVSIYGIAVERPFAYTLDFFGLEIPYLFVTPVAQVGLAMVILHALARRLVSPLNLPLRKTMAYGLLLAIDVLLAGMLFTPLAGLSLVVPAAYFWMGHVLCSLVLTTTITPSRECLSSWLWRFRGRLRWWQDLLWGERSENAGALVVFCLLGVAAGALLIVLPVGWRAGVDVWQRKAPTVAWIFVVGCLLIMSLGSLFQLLQSIGRSAIVMFVGSVGVLTMVPFVIGALTERKDVLAASPVGHFGNWIMPIPAESLPLAPLLVPYAVILLAARFVIRRRIAAGIAVVERKLADMRAAA